MTDSLKRTRRIEAAQQLADVCHSGERVKKDSHRQAWIHDQIADAVKQACAKKGGGQHFTPAQIESLSEIAFNIAFLVDPKNRRRSGVAASIKHGWSEAPLASRVSIIGGSIGIATAIAGVAIWLWTHFAQPESVPAPPAVEEVSPDGGKPVTLQRLAD